MVKKTTTYRDLFKASEWFEDDATAYDSAWLDAWENVDWEHLHSLSTDEVRREVIGFLNKWRCHLPNSETLAERIKEAHLECLPYIDALKDESIEDWDPNKVKDIDGSTQTTEKSLLDLFTCFVIIGERFKWVAASKTLHFILPKLIVMWDNPIADKYRIPLTCQQYVHAFIPKMQRMANEAIDSYQREKRCSRKEAISVLNGFRPPKTIAKLLDEYNYKWLSRGRL